jgi:hypothetical protein
MAGRLMDVGGAESELAIRHKVYLDIVVIANPPYNSILQPI